MTETKEEKFIRLAEKRTNEAIKKIRLIGNLSNKNNYEYSEEQVTTIIKALETEIRKVKNAYQKESEEKIFKLKR
ncbi:hypothetical protein PSQ89_06640 [Pediococcus pentosaceus]|uniref:hypothetical protein n=1 Tax=Pediococcus pentosaceus TaxID=1255 RepID=UPI0023631365|nr:hypothetical protein [Pediococcus pentosaceus]MDD1389864.1 hypothetical protein [Pediococcus pentosaceus]